MSEFTLDDLVDAEQVRTHAGWHRVIRHTAHRVVVANPYDGREETIDPRHVLEHRSGHDFRGRGTVQVGSRTILDTQEAR